MKLLNNYGIRRLCKMAGTVSLEPPTRSCGVCGGRLDEQYRVPTLVVGFLAFQFHTPCLATTINQLLEVENGYTDDKKCMELKSCLRKLERIEEELCSK